MSDRRRKWLLLALLAVLAGVLGLRLLPAGGGGPLVGSRGADEALGPAGGGEAVAEVRLELLDRKRAQYSPGRNPFAFQAAQPKPPPKPRPQQPRPQPPRAAPPRPQQAAEPARPLPPAIDFVFLGSFGPGNRKIGVFTDQTDIYNARIGDVIKERFVVVQIGYESADVGFVGFPDEPAQRLAAGG